MNSLDAIRQRARSNDLGRNLMNVCNQAILDRQALLDHIDTLHRPENTNEPRLCEECAGLEGK